MGGDDAKLTDIRMRDEEKLSFLASIVESSYDAIIGMTLNGIILSWNSGAHEIYYYSANEVIGKSITILVPPDRSDEISSLLKRAGQGESIKNFGTVHIRKDGKQIDISLTVSPVKDADGRITAISSIARDITERKHVEEALKKERDRAQNYLNIAGVMIVAIDANQKVTLVNKKCCEVLGYKEQEIIGSNWFDTFIPERVRDEVRATFMKLIAGEIEPVEFFENPVLTRRGEERLIAWHNNILRDDAGNITETLSSGEDITERRRIEEKLHESEIRYRTLFDQSPDGVLIIDPQTAIAIEFNEIAHRQLGYTWEEFKKLRVSDYEAKEKPEETKAHIEKVLREGRDDFETIHRTKDGKPRNVMVTIKTIELSGRVVFHCIYRDITERKQAEERLREAKELSDALNRINAAINSTLDFDKIMQNVVVESAKAIGCDTAAITLREDNYWIVRYIYGFSEELIGSRFPDEELPHGALAAQSKQPIVINDAYNDERVNREMMEKYSVRSVIIAPLIVKDRVIGLIFFNYHSAPIPFTPVQVDFANKLAIAISLALENARLYAERERYIAELARSNAELEQFAYIASHDLQEPLRMISGFTQLLARRYKGRLDKDADEFIGFVVNGAARMQRMIEDLLAYSQVGTRGKPFEPANLEEIFNQAVTNLKAAIEENKATVTHDPLPTVMADASQMVQLLQNLISNAIKFRKKEETPRIHVSAERKGNEWVFSVKDNGIGIASEFMDHLFQLFQREHPATEYPGTGIGLAICRRIVERHDGRIWAESEVGRGSTLYFTIPVLR